MSLQDNGWSIAAIGANGYSLKFAGAAITMPNNLTGYTVWNYIPRSRRFGTDSGIELAGGLVMNNAANATLATLAGSGDYLDLRRPEGRRRWRWRRDAHQERHRHDDSDRGQQQQHQHPGLQYADQRRLGKHPDHDRGYHASQHGDQSGWRQYDPQPERRNDGSAQRCGPDLHRNDHGGGQAASYINVDRAIGGAGALAQTTTLGAPKSGAFTSFFTNGNNYTLNTGTLTQTGASVLVNEIGGTGSLIIPTLTGTFNATIHGAGTTSINTALTLATGTLTKSGTGTPDHQRPRRIYRHQYEWSGRHQRRNTGARFQRASPPPATSCSPRPSRLVRPVRVE